MGAGGAAGALFTGGLRRNRNKSCSVLAGLAGGAEGGELVGGGCDFGSSRGAALGGEVDAVEVVFLDWARADGKGATSMSVSESPPRQMERTLARVKSGISDSREQSSTGTP